MTTRLIPRPGRGLSGWLCTPPQLSSDFGRSLSPTARRRSSTRVVATTLAVLLALVSDVCAGVRADGLGRIRRGGTAPAQSTGGAGALKHLSAACGDHTNRGVGCALRFVVFAQVLTAVAKPACHAIGHLGDQLERADRDLKVQIAEDPEQNGEGNRTGAEA